MAKAGHDCPIPALFFPSTGSLHERSTVKFHQDLLQDTPASGSGMGKPIIYQVQQCWLRGPCPEVVPMGHFSHDTRG